MPRSTATAEAHHSDPDRCTGLGRSREQDGDVVALDQFRQPAGQLVGRRRRLVVLRVEVVQQLCCGGSPSELPAITSAMCTSLPWQASRPTAHLRREK